MFDFFRKYNKIMMIVLFLLIIPSFVLFGVERYTQQDAASEAVARVDGQDITRPEWEQRHRTEADRLRQQMPNLDPSLLDSDTARYATLERMVRERVLAVATARTHMTVSDESLQRMFAEDPAMAQFKKPDGSFDRELFLRAANMTPEQYVASVRNERATQQLLVGVASTNVVSRAQADVTLGAFHDRREVRIARFDAKDFAGKVSVSDADLETFYKEHAAKFKAPEEATIEYLVLDLASVKKTLQIGEADLKAYYEQNKDRFGTKEERKASHILINAPLGMALAEREKAKARAGQLLEQVRKAPDSFAAVAKASSQDELSARNGGALDMGPRGSFGSKPLEDAMFSLKKGEISGVVETEFGYHIVRVDDIKPAVVQPFEKVRAAIEDEVRNQQAAQEYAKAAESFTDLVYQTPDSLKPAAEKFKLTIQTASHVGRTPAPNAQGVLANRGFISALYAPDSLERKHNTEAIEIGSNQLVSGRVVQHSPERTLPLAEVKEQVRAQLLAERASALAKKEGADKLAAWEKGDKAAVPAGLGAPLPLSVTESQGQPLAVVEATLRADAAKLPAWVGVDLGEQGYAVVRVEKVLPRAEVPAATTEQELAQVRQAVTSAEGAAYYNMLKDRYKARILVPRPIDLMNVLAKN